MRHSLPVSGAKQEVLQRPALSSLHAQVAGTVFYVDTDNFADKELLGRIDKSSSPLDADPSAGKAD